MNILLLASSNNLGDPDTWPEAFSYVGLAICGVAAYYVWARWGRNKNE